MYNIHVHAELPSKKNILEGDLPLQHIFKREKLSLKTHMSQNVSYCRMFLKVTISTPLHALSTTAHVRAIVDRSCMLARARLCARREGLSQAEAGVPAP